MRVWSKTRAMLAATLAAAIVGAVSALAQVRPLDLSTSIFDRAVNGHRVALVQFYAPWCGHCRSMEPAMTRLATYFANDDRVLIARVNGDEQAELRNRFGVQGYPTIKFFPLGQDPQPEDVECGRDFETLRDFVKDRLGTKKSDLPTQKTDSPVVRLDDTNFGSIALDPQRIALVNFYAPWCEHCRALEPIYERLAGIFRNEPGVVIGSMDCDANKATADRYGIQGFPTLKFFGKGTKVPKTYEGGRTIEELVAFVNEQAGTRRLASGDVSRDYGLNADFDVIAKQFFANTALRAQLINDADNRALQSHSPADAYYVYVMRRIKEDGPDWVGPELRRIAAILQSCQVDSPRADGYRVRRNILYRFAELGRLNVGTSIEI